MVEITYFHQLFRTIDGVLAKVFFNRLLLFEVFSFSNVEVWVSDEFYKIPFQSC